MDYVKQNLPPPKSSLENATARPQFRFTEADSQLMSTIIYKLGCNTKNNDPK